MTVDTRMFGGNMVGGFALLRRVAVGTLAGAIVIVSVTPASAAPIGVADQQAVIAVVNERVGKRTSVACWEFDEPNRASYGVRVVNVTPKKGLSRKGACKALRSSKVRRAWQVSFNPLAGWRLGEPNASVYRVRPGLAFVADSLGASRDGGMTEIPYRGPVTSSDESVLATSVATIDGERRYFLDAKKPGVSRLCPEDTTSPESPPCSLIFVEESVSMFSMPSDWRSIIFLGVIEEFVAAGLVLEGNVLLADFKSAYFSTSVPVNDPIVNVESQNPSIVLIENAGNSEYMRRQGFTGWFARPIADGTATVCVTRRSGEQSCVPYVVGRDTYESLLRIW